MIPLGNPGKMSSLPRANPLVEFNGVKSLPQAIDKIERMEAEMQKMPQQEIPTEHFFGTGVYVRTILIKKGTIATGRIQKMDHVSIMLTGHMTLWTPEKGLHDVFGPNITEVKVGMKRIGYAHTDTLWACAYNVEDGIDYTNDELLDQISFKSYNDYLLSIDDRKRIE